MSDHAWTADAGGPAHPPADVGAFTLESYVDREVAATLARGRTMDDWLDEARRYPIDSLTTERIVEAIRELRDSDDPRTLG